MEVLQTDSMLTAPMSNTGTVTFAAWTVILASAAFTRADEKAVADSGPQQQGLEIRRKFAELSRKVNELPELKVLKMDVERAQAAYSAAFEAAMAKEDSHILAQYRGLFESRIQRLRVARQALPGLTAKTETPISENDVKRLGEAQKKAMGAAGVQEALKNWNAAGTEEQREVAKAQYLSALRSAMIEADPSLKPLLVEAGAEASPVSADGGVK